MSDAILVRHNCGYRVWIEWQGDTPKFSVFQILGGEWWKGDAVTVCPRCGENYYPFMSKQWTEAE